MGTGPTDDSALTEAKRLQKNHAMGLVVGLAMLLVIAGLGIGLIHHGEGRLRELAQVGRSVDLVVASTPHQRNGRSTFDVRYEIDGIAYLRSVGRQGPPPDLGEYLSALYLTTQPERVRIDPVDDETIAAEYAQIKTGGFILVLTGFILFAIKIPQIRAARRGVARLEQGRAIHAHDPLPRATGVHDMGISLNQIAGVITAALLACGAFVLFLPQPEAISEHFGNSAFGFDIAWTFTATSWIVLGPGVYIAVRATFACILWARAEGRPIRGLGFMLQLFDANFPDELRSHRTRLLLALAYLGAWLAIWIAYASAKGI